MKTNFILAICGIIAGLTMSAFFRNVDVLYAIGLAVVILGTSLFIAALLIVSALGVYVGYVAMLHGLDSIQELIKDGAFFRGIIKRPIS